MLGKGLKNEFSENNQQQKRCENTKDRSQIDLDLFTQAMVTTAVTSDLHPSQSLQILCGLIRETTLSLQLAASLLDSGFLREHLMHLGTFTFDNEMADKFA